MCLDLHQPADSTREQQLQTAPESNPQADFSWQLKIQINHHSLASVVYVRGRYSPLVPSF